MRSPHTPAHLASLWDGAPPKVVLSYGLGVDSTAILLRWLLDPDSRDFALDDLVVVTALTGDEWAATGADVEAHLLPLLREHGVRYIQAGRSRRHVTAAGDGVVVLDDSREPAKFHLAGQYKLSDEMREAGTIPQSGGARLCSVHAKGEVLTPVIAAVTGGRTYRHALGFEATETRRADKDAAFNTATRTGWYPLRDWGWDRNACLDYIRSITGVTWQRSCCSYCPFALGSITGRAQTLARYADDPEAGLAALLLEHTALALNPTQGLIAGNRLIDAVRDAGHQHLIDLLEARLDDTTHAVYDVRRILRPRRDDPTKLANASRSVRRVATGTRAAMLEELKRHGPVDVGEDRVGRVRLLRRRDLLPTVEHFLVAAPVGVLDKQHDRFDQWWAELTDETLAA